MPDPACGPCTSVILLLRRVLFWDHAYYYLFRHRTIFFKIIIGPTHCTYYPGEKECLLSQQFLNIKSVHCYMQRGHDDYKISKVRICWPAHSGTYRTNTSYVRSHGKVPFVTDFWPRVKNHQMMGFDAQHEGYIIWHPKSIFVAAHAVARAKYETQSNMPLVGLTLFTIVAFSSCSLTNKWLIS